MADTSIKICDITFSSPLMPAAGTIDFGYQHSGFYDINRLGTMVTSGVTMKPERREMYHYADKTNGNFLRQDFSVNPGVYRVQEEELPRLKEVFKKKVFASVCGKTVDEYVKVAEILDRSDAVGILELDMSCRNHDNSGIRFGQNATSLFKAVNEVKYRVRKPVFAKLCPVVTNIRDMAKAAQDGGAEGVVIPGSYFGTAIDIKTKKRVFDGDGIFTSAALKPAVMYNVYEAFDAVGIHVVSCGGVSSAADALEMICAGAALVQLDEAVMKNPLACVEITDALSDEMDKYGIAKVKDIIGAAN